jgi:hypothetical protein
MSLKVENTPSNITAENNVEPQSGLVQFGKEFVAGTLGGIAQVVVGHPFDTVKVCKIYKFNTSYLTIL